MKSQVTPGPWSYACDSYGKVRHSKKACVYSGNGFSKELVSIAARIPNWDDARLIAAAPDLLAALEEIAGIPYSLNDRERGRINRIAMKVLIKAKGA